MSTVQIRDVKCEDEEQEATSRGGSDDFDYEPVDFKVCQEPEEDKRPCDPPRSVAEYTLALIKPSAMRYAREILEKIKESGFRIVRKRRVVLSPEEVSEFYREHYGKPWFPKFILKMSNKALMALCLSKFNAVQDFKTLIGPPRVSEARKLRPFCLRALYGLKGDKAMNAVHGSETQSKAEEELHFFFARMITKPIRLESLSMNFLKERVYPVMLNGLIQVCKERPRDPVIWFANWLLENNPNKPRMPLSILQSPYTQTESSVLH